MRRALAVVVMVAAMLPTPVAAQDANPGFGRWIEEVVALSDLSETLGTIGEGDVAIIRILHSIDTDKAKMLTITPEPCWLDQYLAYWDTLTLYGVLMAIYATGDPGGADEVLSAATAAQAIAFDTGAMADCYG